MGLAAPRHVGSSRTRARTRVPCIGRRILNNCATGEPCRCLFMASLRACPLSQKYITMKIFLLRVSYVTLQGKADKITRAFGPNFKMTFPRFYIIDFACKIGLRAKMWLPVGLQHTRNISCPGVSFLPVLRTPYQAAILPPVKCFICVTCPVSWFLLKC